MAETNSRMETILKAEKLTKDYPVLKGLIIPKEIGRVKAVNDISIFKVINITKTITKGLPILFGIFSIHFDKYG